MNLFNRLFRQPHIYILIVIIGISLKFYKLDEQFFWDDEIATVLHTSGIPMDIYEENIPVNEVVSKTYFDELLKLNDRELLFSDQFIGLSKMPQLTPGHYYYMIFLTRALGDNYMVYRYFSAFMFLLSILFLFLLTKKIFKNNLVAWIAISIYTVSPFFQVYAQEARYYTLWSLALILMNYLFLIAIEKKQLKWWVWYVAIGFLAVHVTILFYITLLAQFIYTLIYHRERWKPVFASLFTIFLSSVPWLIYIILNREDIHDSLEWQRIGSWGELSLFDLLVIHLNQFIDLFVYFRFIGIDGSLMIIGRWFLGSLLIGGIIMFFIKANNKQKWFVGLLTFLGVLIIIALDLIRSSGSSNLPRYLLLNFVGLIMLIGFTFQKLMEKRSILFGGLFLIVIILGIASSYAIASDLTDSKRDDAPYHLQDANEKFSGNERILIISDFKIVVPNSYSAFMSLMHASTNNNIDVIYAKIDYPNFKEDFDFSSYDKVYAMYLSEELLKHLKETYTSEELIQIEKRVIYGMFDISVYSIK